MRESVWGEETQRKREKRCEKPVKKHREIEGRRERKGVQIQ